MIYYLLDYFILVIICGVILILNLRNTPTDIELWGEEAE